LLLDGDTGSVGKSDAHPPDCAASRAQESQHDTVTGPQLWAANDYYRVGHKRNAWVLECRVARRALEESSDTGRPRRAQRGGGVSSFHPQPGVKPSANWPRLRTRLPA
jgi:hypothetical protein